MFYKKEQEQILSALIVEGPGYTLIEEDSALYTYPVDGWIHAESLNAAIAHFASAGKSTITLRQCKLALLNAGKLQDVLAYIDAMPEPQRTAALIEFDYANEVERSSVLLNTVAAAIGLSESELNELFESAKVL
ncbi:MAG: hypothetical protein PHI64_08245 [Zoogloea sp.]|uniref:hypothetical protein n=1 Tax=Zoogloea sp. TaxID=49181 RepID=UPI002603CA37|nr:hypothetical protein [Zoogloea sp.]MDD2988937.1 hypothetical protein [Zoogloea sp.]